jgi:glycosyltransferase involved in cell wall biosynthesis
VTNAEGALTLPTDEERARLGLVQTAWFEDPVEAKAAVASSTVYFAPRTAEGIGQAVLEAMALGLCVVAPNAPTMNEYIVHGETGLLFDPDHPTALDFRRAGDLGRNARTAALEGRARWEASCDRIRAFLVAPAMVRPRRFHPIIVLRGRLTALARSVFRWLKRLAHRA